MTCRKNLCLAGEFFLIYYQKVVVNALCKRHLGEVAEGLFSIPAGAALYKAIRPGCLDRAFIFFFQIDVAVIIGLLSSLPFGQ